MELWLIEYGPYAIFLLLALGIIGLPIPDETLIVLAGVLVAKGKLSLIPTLLAIYCGGMTGITTSYLLGATCGHYLILNYGHLLRLTPPKVDQAKKWFQQSGKWLLFFGYFLMGVRHLTGFIAGMMKLSYLEFATFAYSGLLLWATGIFIIGYQFTHNWHHALRILSLSGIVIALLTLSFIFSYFFYKNKKLN